MRPIGKKIKDTFRTAMELRELEKDENISYEKGKEIRTEQEKMWNKYIFLKNLDYALSKKERY